VEQQTYEKSMEIAATQYHGVEVWLGDDSLSAKERDALAERFAEMLLRYKDLVDGFANDKMNGGDSTSYRIKSLKAWAESLPYFIQGEEYKLWEFSGK
jgi:hypothetical protein